LANEFEEPGRPRTPKQWEWFDCSARGLGVAMAGDSTRAVYEAFDGCATAPEIADALDSGRR
jgi:hypothetical protein